MVAMNGLRDEMTLRHTLGPRLFLTIQKSLLIIVSFFRMISNRIATDQFASLLVPREHLPLTHFLRLQLARRSSADIAVSHQVTVVRNFVRFLLLISCDLSGLLTAIRS